MNTIAVLLLIVPWVWLGTIVLEGRERSEAEALAAMVAVWSSGVGAGLLLASAWGAS